MNGVAGEIPGDLTADIALLVGKILEKPVGPDDDIFDAGVSSLQLVRMISGIDRRWGVRIRAVDIFEHGTSAKLAGLVNDMR